MIKNWYMLWIVHSPIVYIGADFKVAPCTKTNLFLKLSQTYLVAKLLKPQCHLPKNGIKF